MDVINDEEGSTDVTARRLMKTFQVCVHDTTHDPESPPCHRLSALFGPKEASQSIVHCSITPLPPPFHYAQKQVPYRTAQYDCSQKVKRWI